MMKEKQSPGRSEKIRFAQIHFGFPRFMNGKDPLYLICACASIAEQLCITKIR
jgi:hypothetical protein